MCCHTLQEMRAYVCVYGSVGVHARVNEYFRLQLPQVDVYVCKKQVAENLLLLILDHANILIPRTNTENCKTPPS
jgi:hypothetical protein